MKYLFLLTVLISTTVFAQKVEYTEVVQVDSTSAHQLYSKSKLFITSAFVSGKDVTQLADDEAKTMVAKGLIPVKVKTIGWPIQANVKFSLTLQNKDGKYKYSATDFVFVYQPGTMAPAYEYAFEEADPKGLSKKQWASVKEQTDTAVKELVAKLKKDMAANKSDW